ncbi:MAG: histidine phosphatase family protein [Acidaminococcaceae bacterium]|nr:histidine phosphatase family protein [Acidaminococcaceae bacterium]
MRIYLIRHGQTSGNSEKRFQGRIDTPLNKEGFLQAKALATFMKDVQIDAIYSSTLLRAKMTAAVLAGAKNMSYLPHDGLEEVCFGEWEGLRYDEIERRWPDSLHDFFTRPGECLPPNGESFAQAKQRSDAALQEIIKWHGSGDNIAVVSHGGIIRLNLCGILGMPLNNLWRINIHNVSVTGINVYDGLMSTDMINDFHFVPRAENI